MIGLMLGYFIVDSIEIIGNKTTLDFVILDELTFGVGDTITNKDLAFNRERVFSLGIFNEVTFSLVKSESEIIEPEVSRGTLNITIMESWYLYPLPFVDRKDKDWNKLSYGLDFIVRNFRGRNEFVRFRFALGYDPEVVTSYYIPYLFRKENIFLGIDGIWGRIKNKSIRAENIYGDVFNQEYLDLRVNVGKRLDLFNRVSLFSGYKQIKTKNKFEQISLSGKESDKYIYLAFNYNYDTRDLAQFPNSGEYLSLFMSHNGFGSDNINFNILSVDFREYIRLYWELLFKYRLGIRHTFGSKVPFFEYSYLGYGEAVRGYYYDKREGNTSLVSSIELAMPIIKEYTLSFDFPMIPVSLTTFRIGLFFQVFYDIGIVKLREDKFRYNDLQRGWGFGFTGLSLPYNLGRFELAFDNNMNAEIILDIGVSF